MKEAERKMNKMKTIKKLAFAAMFAAIGAMAWMQEAVAAVEEGPATVETTYYAWDKDARRVTGPHVVQAIPLTGSAMTTTLEDGKWYVVRKDEKTEEIQLPTLFVDGDAHLILEDGVNARVNSTEKESPGIWLQTPGSVWDAVKSSISIYGQEAGTGRLQVDGDGTAAAIGTTSWAFGVGTVNIHGGRIEARGGNNGGAAIGTGAESIGCFDDYPELPCTFAINIYGGTVLADASSSYGGPGLGFGFGSKNPHCEVTVLGGDVTARSSEACECVSAIGLGMNCQKFYSDPQTIDYFKFTLGRGMGLWTALNKDTGEDEVRMTAAEYDAFAINNEKLLYAHIKPAPVTKVTVRVLEPSFTSYTLSTNGVPVQVEDGHAPEHLYELPGAVEVEVVYTTDAEHQFSEGKKTWTRFIGAQDIEGASEFVVEPPPVGTASPEVELVAAIPFKADFHRVFIGGDMHNYKRICRLELKDPARAAGTSYFWVAFKDLNDTDFEFEEKQVIWDNRRKFDEVLQANGVGWAVGWLDEVFDKEMGGTVSSVCANNEKYCCETGTVTDLGAEPFIVELPGDTEAIYIFKFADNKTTAVGGNANVLTHPMDTNDIWVNKLVGATVVQSYYAWDAQQGKVVQQAPVEATVLKAANETAVLHPGKWYVVMGEVDLPGIRVDVGTAHVILAEGAQLYVYGDVTVDHDATLAVYSGVVPRQERWCREQTYFVSCSEFGNKAEVKGGLSGGTLVVHGGCFSCRASRGPAISNRRTVIYDGVIWAQGTDIDGSVISSRTIDVVGGRFEGWADYGSKIYWDGFPLNVVAGEQDGDVCTLNVHVGGLVDLGHNGIGHGGGVGSSAIGDALDIQMDDGIYVWSGSSSSDKNLTLIPLYRANPKEELVICSSAETIKEQDFALTAVYDENLKTNGFTLKLPEGDLRPGEKWFVLGVDEHIARMDVDEDMPMTIADFLQLEFEMMTTEFESHIVGDDMFVQSTIEGGFGNVAPELDYVMVTGESTIEIPAAEAVDMILLGRALDTADLPVVTFGMAKNMQSLQNGETVSNSFEFVTKQELSVDPVGDGTYTLTLPSEDVLKDGESWTWISFPAGIGDNDELVGEIFEAYGSAPIPVGAMSFEFFFSELGAFSNGHGSTTDQVIPLPAGTAAVIVGKTRAGFSLEEGGPTDYLLVTLGGASHLNVEDYADWPRHDEIFPTEEDFCTVTIPESDKILMYIMADGVELGYRPDGVYTVRKGSDVRVFIEPIDKNLYELRSPSVLVYSNIQKDITVNSQDVVVIEKTAPVPISSQGFVVRRAAGGTLSVDMSGEDALNAGEMWVCLTIDKNTSEFADMDSGDSFGDLAWRNCPGLVGSKTVGTVTLDSLMLVPGAENIVVTTNSVFAIPSDSELMVVARAYDGYNGKIESERYYALSLGGARRISELKPGESVEGERWGVQHQVRYSAWDGEKIVHGHFANALPLDENCFDANGVMSVTANSIYSVSGVVRPSDNPVIVIADGVTLSLIVKDGARLDLGCIQVPAKATLNIYGQDDCTGEIRLNSYMFNGGMVPLLGGAGADGCGTINIHGGMIAVYDFRNDMTKAALGGCDAATEANGALNIYRGGVYVNGETVIGIGGYRPMQVNVRGGSVVVEEGAIFGHGTSMSGITLGTGYKLLCGDHLDEPMSEMSVGEYEKMMSAMSPPVKTVRIVRPAALTFDADIAALVNAGKLSVKVLRNNVVQEFAKGDSGVGPEVAWTAEGGSYAVECGDRVHIIFLLNGKESMRRPDVMTFNCITGDVAVTLADLKWREPEVIVEQEFDAHRCLDGRVRLAPKGQLAEGEAWMWITLPEFMAKTEHPELGLQIEEVMAQRFEEMLANGGYYIGGKSDAGGDPEIAFELRPLYNCFQGQEFGIPFLPTDGFHWGMSYEKNVFYAPADSEFAMVCKVYDSGIMQIALGGEKEKEPAKKAVALKAKQSKYLIDEEIMMMLASRYMMTSVGTLTDLQSLPCLPELEPGDAGNPWPLGPNDAAPPSAYTNDTHTLVIEGEGPFAEPTKKPWLDEGVGPITEIVIKNPETELPDDIFEGLGMPDPIDIELPDGWPAGDMPTPGQPWHGGYVKIKEGHWPLTISNVRFQQRYPWNGLVDITFDLTGSTNVELAVVVKDGLTEIAASNFVGRTDMMFEVEGKTTVSLVWDADKDAFTDGLTRRILANATITVGASAEVGGVSAAAMIDLAKGTRVARPIENIVIDPAWGAAVEASVLWPKTAAPQVYVAAMTEKWSIDHLPAGKYDFAYSAGQANYTAAFWVPADSWTVIDHETITGERPVTGDKVLVAGENVIGPGGKLVIEGNPEFIWDGGFKVEEGGKIYAPNFDVVIDPVTGLVTLEPKAKPTVTGLKFAQRYPWNGLVDVYFTASYAKDPSATVWVKLAAKLNDEEKSVKTLYLANDAAHTNTQFEVAQGEVHLVWDTMKDVGLENFGELEITALVSITHMAEEAEPVEPVEPSDEAPALLRFESMDKEPIFKITYSGSDLPQIEVSQNGNDWITYMYSEELPWPVVYVRGMNPNGLTKSSAEPVQFDLTGTWNVSGDVMSLIDYTKRVTEIPCAYCFYKLFYRTPIFSVPELSATELKPHCYESMFEGCYTLKYGPALPAEMILEAAYLMMFANCTTLNSIEFGGKDAAGDGLKSWMDNVASDGHITIIGEGNGELISKLDALPPGWSIVDNVK